MRRALVLAAHGSHLDARASLPVFRHAAALAARPGFDAVRVAFWKEEPSLSRALDGLVADEVVVVPVFMAEGYFVNEVLPRELGLPRQAAARGGHTVRLGPPLGVHPGIDDVVLARASEAGPRPGEALAILGHGTSRAARSSASVQAAAERIRARGEFADVLPVFLEQEPSLDPLLGAGDWERIILVPFFVGEGWHVGQGLPGWLVNSAAGGRVFCTLPVGSHPRAAEVLLSIAEETAR